ncbi:hypothetical protein D1AOALGA4SA_7297 [Olavius algarvensis Delta 1 endosymbiont]|nr:hypothetical protein D1AOALGA4SA_7297 [Olavius algarvensis Delta 1 endosymbiont]
MIDLTALNGYSITEGAFHSMLFSHQVDRKNAFAGFSIK